MKRITNAYRLWLVAARVLLLTAALSVHSFALADGMKWYLISQDANGETQEFPMSDVGSLVAVDDAHDFSVLSATGSVLAEGVVKVTFEQKDPVGIRSVEKEGNTIGHPLRSRRLQSKVRGNRGLEEVQEHCGDVRQMK